MARACSSAWRICTACGDIRTYIDERRALLVVQIEQDFERQLLLGQAADVQVIADGRNSNTAATASSYVSCRGRHVQRQLARRITASRAAVLTSADRAWYNPNLETRWNMIPGLIGTLTHAPDAAADGDVGGARARAGHVRPTARDAVPAVRDHGRQGAAVHAGRALSQATGVLLVAQLWFRIPFAGSIVTLFLGLLMFLLAAVGIGLLLSAVAATMQQAMLSRCCSSCHSRCCRD